jgi:hypothetical protein
MQFNGPVLPTYDQEAREKRPPEMEVENPCGQQTGYAEGTSGDVLAQRLASDREQRESDARDIQSLLDSTYRLETHARTACVLAGLLSIPVWMAFWLPMTPLAPPTPEWIIDTTFRIAFVSSVTIPASSLVAAAAWCWRRRTLRVAKDFCLEVRDPARH